MKAPMVLLAGLALLAGAGCAPAARVAWRSPDGMTGPQAMQALVLCEQRDALAVQGEYVSLFARPGQNIFVDGMAQARGARAFAGCMAAMGFTLVPLGP